MNAPQTLPALPRDDPDFGGEEAPLATARWVSSETILGAMREGEKDAARSPIILGQLWDGARNRAFYTDDDRHVLTIAGSRAGKGRSLILPNLLAYPGSVVCIDPKGENAAVTARYRHDVLGQNVVILDPFDVLKDVAGVAEFRGRFNPFEWITLGSREAIDDVSALADAMIVRDNEKDPHWNESARAFLKGVMLTLMDLLPPYAIDPATGDATPNWTLSDVRKLASMGMPPPGKPHEPRSLDGLLDTMTALEGFDGAIAAAGYLVRQMGENERGGVLSNLRRHTEFLESAAIIDNVQVSDFNPGRIKAEPTTIYLVLPEWRMSTHSRWLRLVLTTILQGLQRAPTEKLKPAALIIFDEFATLGHMESVERAAGYIAGFGVKLWFILQDLSQLKSLYTARWETFLGNAGTLTAFGNIDFTTLSYLSQRLGKTELLRTLINTTGQEGRSESSAGLARTVGEFMRGRFPGGLVGNDSEGMSVSTSTSAQQSLQAADLITPDEIARYFARENEVVLVHLAGHQPFRLSRIRYELDAPYSKRAAKSPYH